VAIYDTDVASITATYASGPKQLLNFPARVKGVVLYAHESGSYYPCVDLYDGTSASGTPKLRLYCGDQRGRLWPPFVCHIPGNGIRFSTAVWIAYPNVSRRASVDQPLYVTVNFQAG